MDALKAINYACTMLTKEEFHSGHHKLVYLREGVGNHRLIFLHGLCGKKEFWTKQLSFFKEDYEVFSLDLLGHGESTPTLGRNLIDENVLVLQKLMSKSPKPTTVVGHSLGGMIVNALIDTAECIENFIFVDSPCLAQKEKLDHYNNYYQVILAQEDSRRFFRDWFSAFVTEKASTTERKDIIDEAARRDPQWMADVMAGLCAPQKKNLEPSAVFVMAGTQYYGSDMKTSWRQLYPSAKSWMYQGRGHFYFLEDPAPFNDSLLNFLRSRT